MFKDIFYPIYNNFQQETFYKTVECNKYLAPLVKGVYKFHKQPLPKIKYSNDTIKYIKINKNKKVLLCYSGGLDSIYQAFYLRNKGYDVILYHVKGINKFENGQSTKVTKEFAYKFGFDLIEIDNIKTEHNKYWPENPVKNQMILSIAIDYCIEQGVYNVADGDNYTLLTKNATVGVNYTDTKECNENFESFVNKFCDINFIHLGGKNRQQEIKYIEKYSNMDYVYSCLSPGRFNQSWRKRVINKYDIDENIIPKYNCCTCRKCASQILLLKYLGYVKFNNEDFEEYLWSKQLSGKYAARDFVWKKATKGNRVEILLDD